MQYLKEINKENIESLWGNCLEELKNTVDRITYETIIRYIHPSMKDSTNLNLVLSKAWQKDPLGKYIKNIEEIIYNKTGKKINISLVITPNNKKNIKENIEIKPVSSPKKRKNSLKDIDIMTSSTEEIRLATKKSLNPRYIFDNFVVGSSNRFAHAAAQAVADSPAIAYNPLFIYGGVGLGKTHLINAIGNRVFSNNPTAKIVYVSTEKFMNDMIESIQKKQMMNFRKKYRKVDILLIDDIQFIKNKESTQEEFFHTFNELHNAKSQIVITSDRPPKDIPTLEDRLRSRFEWGVIADISPPDLETRMAILKKKAEIEKVKIPNEVILYIAEKIPSNIRELEGALNRVICYGSLMKLPINMEMALQALKTIINNTPSKNLTITVIQEKVCDYYNITMENLKGKRRDSKLVLPRQIAMYLIKEIIGSSFPVIGKSFGGRDHTTVMHAYRKITKIKSKPSIKNDLQNLKDTIKNFSG